MTRPSAPVFVDLDGPANFRDLGGYPTSDGATIRRGRVFRSDSLSYLSAVDVEHLREVVDVRTVIDLRAPHEVETFGHGPLESHVRQLHMPIVDETRRPLGAGDRDQSKFLTLEEIYRFMLVEYARRFGAVLNVIGDLETHPLVFHCAAGKDRTGLTAALVLGMCGVVDDVIAADFSVTEARMPTIVARHTARADSDRVGAVDAPQGAEVAGQQYGAQAATMAGVLVWIRAEYGSIVGYVEHAGVTTATRDRLRSALVVPENTLPIGAPTSD